MDEVWFGGGGGMDGMDWMGWDGFGERDPRGIKAKWGGQVSYISSVCMAVWPSGCSWVRWVEECDGTRFVSYGLNGVTVVRSRRQRPAGSCRPAMPAICGHEAKPQKKKTRPPSYPHSHTLLCVLRKQNRVALS